jgi:raffinose/stachyose/melibiose transport system permease protein
VLRNKAARTVNLQVILLFLLPTLIFYTMFLIVPVFDSLRLSFFSGKLLRIDKFVGLANYRKLFTVPPFNVAFFNAFGNTLELFVIMAVIQNTLPLAIAVIITRTKFVSFFRVVFFIPSLVPLIVVGFLFKMILNPVWGIVDKALRFAQLGFLVRPWLGDANLAIPVIALIGGWVYFGMPFVLFLAGINGIDRELFEAARIDGASELTVTRRIIIPLLLPVFGIVSTLALIGNITQFDLIYSAANAWGDPAYHTDVFGTLFYRTMFGANNTGATSDLGLAAALASVMFVLVLVGEVLVLRVTRRRGAA